jgi:hypothetical protein
MYVQIRGAKTMENQTPNQKIPREIAIKLPTETLVDRPIQINEKDKDGNITSTWIGDIISCQYNEDGTYTIIVVEKI